MFMCVFAYNSKSNRSGNIKLEYIVVYDNISDKFDNGHCRIKFKVTVGLFVHLPQYKLLGPITITQLSYKLGSLY